jgi:glutamate-1-semialdehyde 2,1-aminomutase
VYDLDGNRYIDTMLGFGTWVAGHKPPGLTEAITDQLERGLQFGIHNRLQEKLANLILPAGPGDRVIFCNSGTEATMYAIRAARAYTGRTMIATFDGSYHGAHDDGSHLVDPASPPDRPVTIARGAGIPPRLRETHLKLPHLSAAAFTLIAEHGGELAAVLIEGVQGGLPQLNPEIGEFLTELIAVAHHHGVLVILDEVVSGFRIAFGGASEHYRVRPDLTTYGKALGGGVPIGAVAGRSDVMAVFAGPAEHRVGIFSGGSFSGNPLSMAAGIAHVGYLAANRARLYPRLNSEGDRLASEFNSFARAQGMAVQMLNAGSMFQIFFTDAPIRTQRDIRGMNRIGDAAFNLHLLRYGVLIPGSKRAFISSAHTPDVVDEMLAAMRQSLLDVRADGEI